MFLRVLAIFFLGAWSCLCKRQLELGSVSNAPSACDSGSTQCGKSVPEAVFSPAVAGNVSNGHPKPPRPSQSAEQGKFSVEADGHVSSGKNNTRSQKKIIFSGKTLTSVHRKNGTAADKHLSSRGNRTINVRSTACDIYFGSYSLAAYEEVSYWCNFYSTNTANAYWEYVYVEDDGEYYIESYLSTDYNTCMDPTGTIYYDYQVHGYGDTWAVLQNVGLIYPGDTACLVLNSDDPTWSQIYFDIVYNFYDWYAYSWSSCSASCGYGTQTRYVECALNSGYGSAVSDSYCISAYKPSTSQSCYTPCPSPPPSPPPPSPPPSPPPPLPSPPPPPGSPPPPMTNPLVYEFSPYESIGANWQLGLGCGPSGKCNSSEPAYFECELEIPNKLKLLKNTIVFELGDDTYGLSVGFDHKARLFGRVGKGTGQKKSETAIAMIKSKKIPDFKGKVGRLGFQVERVLLGKSYGWSIRLYWNGLALTQKAVSSSEDAWSNNEEGGYLTGYGNLTQDPWNGYPEPFPYSSKNSVLKYVRLQDMEY